MYILHNLHVEDPGFQCLNADLNKFKVVDTLIWESIISIFLVLDI